MSYATVTREDARRASRKALYATYNAAYRAPHPLFCKYCGAPLFPPTSAAAGRCTGPLTCSNAYTD